MRLVPVAFTMRLAAPDWPLTGRRPLRLGYDVTSPHICLLYACDCACVYVGGLFAFATPRQGCTPTHVLALSTTLTDTAPDFLHKNRSIQIFPPALFFAVLVHAPTPPHSEAQNTCNHCHGSSQPTPAPPPPHCHTCSASAAGRVCPWSLVAPVAPSRSACISSFSRLQAVGVGMEVGGSGDMEIQQCKKEGGK